MLEELENLSEQFRNEQDPDKLEELRLLQTELLGRLRGIRQELAGLIGV